MPPIVALAMSFGPCARDSGESDRADVLHLAMTNASAASFGSQSAAFSSPSETSNNFSSPKGEGCPTIPESQH